MLPHLQRPLSLAQRLAGILCVLAVLIFGSPAHAGFFGFGSDDSKKEETIPTPTANTTGGTSVQSAYLLGPGDKVRITIFNEPDLSGEFEVNSTGVISMPLIGDVKAQGQTLQQLQTNIQTSLGNGYLLDPKVSIDVMSFRPFFIVGEVNQPGSYPYVNSLTVLNAVALAGGYTYRAKEGAVTVRRIVNGQQTEFTAQETDNVLPGDVIRVKERLF